jgi:cbb3-type cytochrome oxidase maturation protein
MACAHLKPARTILQDGIAACQETNMYYSGWIMLVGMSLWVSLIAFVWALRSGQFNDSGRACYLPLADEYHGAPRDPAPARTKESCALLAVAAIGLAGIASALWLSLVRLQ